MATRDTVDGGASRLVGRYELLAPVVSGALGELWQARIASGPEEGRVVAIRRVSRSVGLEKRDVERFANAGFAAMELRNPRIAAVLDVVVGATEIAIVSEHVAGAVLQCLLSPEPGRRVNVPSGVASRIALDLLEAIDALRDPWAEIFPSDSAEDALLRTSLHGGLLPDGLLVAGYGEAMLLEAGLAGVALTLPVLLDRPDVIVYRAPEQLEPGRPIDERTDVFSVGILFWEMVSGRPLFGPVAVPGASSAATSGNTGADPVAVSGARRRVLSHPVARLDVLPLSKGRVPKELADWAARCLERDPARRFASVRDAMEALSSLRDGIVSGHDGVVGFIESLGLAAPVLSQSEQSSGPGSSRPTSPPQEDVARSKTDGVHEGVTRPGIVPRRAPSAQFDAEASPDGATGDFGETAEAHAARMLELPDSIPPSADVESLPPSETTSADAESLTPSEPTPLQETATHGAVQVAAVPPAEAVTVPLLTAREANRFGLIGDDRGVTPMSPPTTPDRAPDGSAAMDMVASGAERPDADEVRREVNTSAPVARSLEHPTGAPPKPGGADEFSTRRARSKKIVFGVLAASVLLVMVAVLRAALVGAPGGSPAAQAPAPTTQAVIDDAPRRPAVPEATPSAVPSAEPSAQASAAAPTSVPTVPPGKPGENPVRKTVSAKKRPWRPSGI